METLQQTVADLSRVRLEAARLETNWRSQRHTLDATVEALDVRAETLERQQATLAALGSEQNQKFAVLTEQARAARARLEEAELHLRAISDELLALRPWLPPRISRALELPFRSLADPALPCTERLQLMTSIWSRCAQFNGVITCETETLTIDRDAPPRMLEVIYWGLSHGYALDRIRQVAYFGRPEATGWAWREEPALVASVARLVAIFRDEAEPAFITLPVHVTAVVANERP